MSVSTSTALITGFPRLLARGLALHGLRRNSRSRVVLLVDTSTQEAARAFIDELPSGQRRRVRLLSGSLQAGDLGLTGKEVSKLLETITHIFHPAGVTGGSRTQQTASLNELNRLLQLAKDCQKIQRICLFTTAFVSGNRTGVIYEEDLAAGQSLRSPYEEAMYTTETIARASMPRLPITVCRPSAMIGHSRTGDASGLTEGPSYLLSLMLKMPSEVPFFLPGSGVVPFNIVPIDYVVRAAWLLAMDPVARGRTFHLTDPNPVSTRRAFELFADIANRPAPRFNRWAIGTVSRIIGALGFESLIPSAASLVGDLTQDVTYSCAGTLERLADSDVRCPPFDDYADTLVRWMADVERVSRRQFS